MESSNNQQNLQQDYKDFKLGKLYILAGIANLFCGIYSTIILFICNRVIKDFNKDKEYLRFSFIIFGFYFLYIYYFLFYGILNDQRDSAEEKFADTLFSNIFYSLPISIYKLITFSIKFIKFKVGKWKKFTPF